ncbi:hypothetical protein GNI_064450 [Gregarina niphandrodes]|uniref:Uncharacterized protein n=1 Tax=Gregarina niphandrodes TaxID=110365 RepID=A0A023B815_GRENI|nr:hypothetical protein GNI_064450 [Gregarina niphandrodes]EZG68116.1 hypothetical protein GNI_064450 [Gregarina niphandrodes]|eukprot:XP_011130101.1 hypothetical protein GNI_064450 [Gregarina niphandrodes]
MVTTSDGDYGGDGKYVPWRRAWPSNPLLDDESEVVQRRVMSPPMRGEEVVEEALPARVKPWLIRNKAAVEEAEKTAKQELIEELDRMFSDEPAVEKPVLATAADHSAPGGTSASAGATAPGGAGRGGSFTQSYEPLDSPLMPNDQTADCEPVTGVVVGQTIRQQAAAKKRVKKVAEKNSKKAARISSKTANPVNPDDTHTSNIPPAGGPTGGPASGPTRGDHTVGGNPTGDSPTGDRPTGDSPTGDSRQVNGGQVNNGRPVSVSGMSDGMRIATGSSSPDVHISPEHISPNRMSPEVSPMKAVEIHIESADEDVPYVYCRPLPNPPKESLLPELNRLRVESPRAQSPTLGTCDRGIDGRRIDSRKTDDRGVEGRKTEDRKADDRKTDDGNNVRADGRKVVDRGVHDPKDDQKSSTGMASDRKASTDSTHTGGSESANKVSDCTRFRHGFQHWRSRLVF